MRQLKFHENKLLKKVDFFSWKTNSNTRESSVIRKYYIQNREDYVKYSKIVGHVTKLVSKIKDLPQDNETRLKVSEQLLQKLSHMGLISDTTNLTSIEHLSVSALCRRRLPVVMVRLKMSENLKEAVTMIEHGHIRVGPHAITDASYLVTKTMEDYVTWVDSSKIKRTIMKYNDKLDDFDLLGN